MNSLTESMTISKVSGRRQAVQLLALSLPQLAVSWRPPGQVRLSLVEHDLVLPEKHACGEQSLEGLLRDPPEEPPKLQQGVGGW